MYCTYSKMAKYTALLPHAQTKCSRQMCHQVHCITSKVCWLHWTWCDRYKICNVFTVHLSRHKSCYTAPHIGVNLAPQYPAKRSMYVRICTYSHRLSLLQHLHSVFPSLATQLLCRQQAPLHQDRHCIWSTACSVHRHSHVLDSISGSWEEETHHTGKQLLQQRHLNELCTHLAHHWWNCQRSQQQIWHVYYTSIILWVFLCAHLQVHSFLCKEETKTMKMQLILFQFMTHQNQRP